MDSTLKQIADFSSQLKYEDLSTATVHECKRRVVDTLACALGGFDAEPAKLARAVARRMRSDTPARILGSLEPSSPELAAFANGVMMRYLDFNDAHGNGGGHPSDFFAALLAAGEAAKADGKAFITAAVVAYETSLAFSTAIHLGKRGWDTVIYTVLAAAAGVANIMKLDQHTTANGLALAMTPNMALGVVRRGQLSMWKACAAGNASRNAIFAMELAAEGITGPQSVFEGENGVWNAVGKFTLPQLGSKERSFRIADTQIKIYPCIYPGQSSIEAMLAIRSQVEPDQIETIVVRTYKLAWFNAGSEPEKWAPTGRETADHSIPYLICAALLDGKVDAATFTEERIADVRLRNLMQKVQVIHDPALDQLQLPHNSNPCRLEITLKNGQKKTSNVDFPKGHVMNPATDKDIENKLASLSSGLLSASQGTKLQELCWRLEELDDIGELISATRI